MKCICVGILFEYAMTAVVPELAAYDLEEAWRGSFHILYMHVCISYYVVYFSCILSACTVSILLQETAVNKEKEDMKVPCQWCLLVDIACMICALEAFLQARRSGDEQVGFEKMLSTCIRMIFWHHDMMQAVPAPPKKQRRDWDLTPCMVDKKVWAAHTCANMSGNAVIVIQIQNMHVSSQTVKHVHDISGTPWRYGLQMPWWKAWQLQCSHACVIHACSHKCWSYVLNFAQDLANWTSQMHAWDRWH